MKEKLLKEKITNTKINNSSESKRKQEIKVNENDEFVEVISISTGKVKRMRFAKDLSFINNN